jgi:hypothetical protein
MNRNTTTFQEKATPKWKRKIMETQQTSFRHHPDMVQTSFRQHPKIIQISLKHHSSIIQTIFRQHQNDDSIKMTKQNLGGMVETSFKNHQIRKTKENLI